MPSYYEVLKLDSNASAEVIEAAIDDQYNQFRRLVNHHDPNVVEQANRALRQLEDIRSTLTDPTKRQTYDESLNYGGLSDPGVLLAGTATPNPPTLPRPAPTPTASTSELSSGRPCPNCGKVNRVGSKVCPECGHIVGRNCPNGCGNVIHLSEKFCSTCGADVQVALARLQNEFENAQMAGINEIRRKRDVKRAELDRLMTLSSDIPVFRGTHEIEALLGENPTKYYGCIVAVAIYFLGTVGIAIGMGIGHLLGAVIGNDVIHLLLIVSCSAVFGAAAGAIIFWTVRNSGRSKVRDSIDRAIQQRQEFIRHAERRMQEEQAKQFDPLSPRRYSPTMQ